MGRRGEHTCTKKVSVAPEYANLGEDTCYKKKFNGKTYKEGKNPYCGTMGLCCRYDQLKDKSSGCKTTWKKFGIPGKKYHHCVRGWS